MLASVPITFIMLLTSLAAALPAPAPYPRNLYVKIAPYVNNYNATRNYNNTVCLDGKTNGPVVGHTIVQGDTLTKLAASFQSGICNIVKASNITNIDLLNIGQMVRVPTKLCRHVVDDKTCLPTPGTRICLPDGPATRVIQPGDSFIGISQKLNLTEAAVVGANKDVDRFKLRVNQTISLPVCGK
ncbi:intracellular hyphae protein 1 [Magnaporthiopsis poae ATCC 64411]|uniref:Intracellular hyphae protein 1 n=1 Tax=Magnaporthiopsis poae (strain ATCC 64411 / 73-15) TaxID=644358 RepID=A0A0C4DUN6_MAGP6|nr:intracellular hyphae protein 1 [Magnaporthiopsis poae ATCC 64411]